MRRLLAGLVIGMLLAGASGALATHIHSSRAEQAMEALIRADGTCCDLSTGTGTLVASQAAGDLFYAASATTLARLAGVAAGSVLVSGATPAWSATPTLTGVLLGNGTAAAPSLAFSSDTTTGFHYATGAVRIVGSISGTDHFGFYATGLQLDSTASLQWSSGAINSTSDLLLARDAANSLGLRNGTNPQTVSVYNTYIPGTPDWERLESTFLSNVAIIRTNANGTGLNRALQLRYGGTTASAISIPTSAAGTIDIAGSPTVGTAVAAGHLRLGGVSNMTPTSGTHVVLNISENAAPTATSTMVFQPLLISSTINYSNGTPGAGSYEALKIAVTETALPTGTNYLARLSAGVAGTTDIFTVTNTGLTTTAAAGAYVFSGRSQVKSSADKLIQFLANGGTGLEYNLDGVTIGTCGTGAVTTGSKGTAGEVTATGATTCTVNFTTAWTNVPFCTMDDETTVGGRISVLTVNAITFTGILGGDKVTWNCVGRI